MTDKDKRIDALERALDLCFIGGNHLVHLIGPGKIIDRYTPHEQALKHYGAGSAYDAWCCWSAIMRARDMMEVEGHA